MHKIFINRHDISICKINIVLQERKTDKKKEENQLRVISLFHATLTSLALHLVMPFFFREKAKKCLECIYYRIFFGSPKGRNEVREN